VTITNDGWDDLFCGFWGHNILFRNNGDGTFTDASEKAGILKPGPRYSITAASYDVDNDGWPDIYVAVDSQPSILFHNNHDGTFTDVAVMAGCAYSEDGREQAGMGIAVGDYDCDGWLDLMQINGHVYPEIAGHEVGQNHKNPHIIYQNMGNGHIKMFPP
jgi:hypothetical protein